VPDRPRSGTVPSWGLKLGAAAAVLNVFFLAFGFAAAHVKNVTAPLQPPVVRAEGSRVEPLATPVPTIAPTTRRGGRPGITLQPGIRTSPAAPLTSTRHS
jgi:hypothetical protein